MEQDIGQISPKLIFEVLLLIISVDGASGGPQIEWMYYLYMDSFRVVPTKEQTEKQTDVITTSAPLHQGLGHKLSKTFDSIQ